MKIISKDKNGADIEFSWLERWIIFSKGKLTMDGIFLKKFTDILLDVLIRFNMHATDGFKHVKKFEDIKKENEQK
jgi:hypothetical protein